MDAWDVFLNQFAKESDRACVIVTASILDELLRELLVAHFLPTTATDDALFDVPNAPLATFSSRIITAYRLGLISNKFARDLHLVRKIRNDFAHSIQGCEFDDSRVHARVLALSRSNSIVHRSKEAYPEGEKTPARVQFLESVSWMVFYLQAEAASVRTVDSAMPEWGYNFTNHPQPEPKDKAEPEVKQLPTQTQV
jgi:DNA-binding MltR family transcriptional regulator